MQSAALSTYSKNIDLLTDYCRNPSVELRNQIVRANAGLVRKTAHRLCHQCSEPYDDLEQVGYLGLIYAVERFTTAQGCAFSSFAMPYIRGEMLHFLRDRGGAIRIPRRWQELQRDGQRIEAEIINKTGRLPSDTDVAIALNIKADEWREIKLATLNKVPLSLDREINGDSPMTLADVLADTEVQDFEPSDEEALKLQRALARLEPKARIAVEFAFLLNLSRKEVASKLGVSANTATRRIRYGIEQLISSINVI